MTLIQSRYFAPLPPKCAEGWALERLTQPSRLYGANGICTGPDGRIWVAQVSGSQISAIDPDSGEIETISAMGGDIVAPDDLVFDEHGNLYITEITEGRVSMRTPQGKTTVLRGDMPVANPITYHQGRLFAGECRVGGRIMELDRNGGEPRVFLADVPMPNAFQIGADGALYAPIMGANEIWRINVETGEKTVVAADLGVPDSVKFDSQGRIISTQVASGDVLRLDLQSGNREILANLGPGLDNCTLVGERIFISSINGSVTEILASGGTRSLIGKGLQWPLGIAFGADGSLFICDGIYGYSLAADQADASPQMAGMIFWPGCPGYMRGVAAGSVAGEWIVTTGLGAVARYRPQAAESDILASGLDRLMDVVVYADGDIIVTEFGTGRLLQIGDGEPTVLADGLSEPMGLAIGPDGAVYVAESGAGRILRYAGGRTETICETLGQPQGLTCIGDALFVLDVGQKSLVAINLSDREAQIVASDLPVGPPQGLYPKPLGPIGDMAGPMINFAGLTHDSAGRIYIAGDGEGSVLRLSPNGPTAA
jgi:sugar lactone lactonase YvrE